jgi:acyl-CoA reductase-like NAD-dependent aldehyde dehydrogenase
MESGSPRRKPSRCLIRPQAQKLADVPDLSADDARRAIDAAYKAFPAWAAKLAKERAQILRRWFELIIAETEPLAQLMTAVSVSAQRARSPRWGITRSICAR